MTRLSSLSLGVTLALALALAPVARAGEFGIAPGTLKVVALAGESGLPAQQASSHPYSWTISFALNTDSQGFSEGGELRDVLVDLPPGWTGDPFALPRCPRQEFEGLEPHCSPQTQVGVLKAKIRETSGFLAEVKGPIYNIVPPPGTAAQLGFSGLGLIALQNVSVLPEDGYRVRSTTGGIPLEATRIEATVWGVPSDPTHDGERGPGLGAHGEDNPGALPELAFLTLPAQCSTPPVYKVSVDSKQEPDNFVSKEETVRGTDGNPFALTGCDAVPFNPTITAAPTSAAGSSSSGLDFMLKLPNEGLNNPDGIAETEPVKTEVTLPPGVTANPSAAAGLSGCSEEQFAKQSTCPESSKLGTLTAESPLLEEPIEGAVYLGTPLKNRFGTLVSLYLIASAPQRGVLIKQAGRVDIDQATGQLTTTFDGLPPLPYSNFKLQLREGPRAPLTMPTACGTYSTTAKLYPFSEPEAAKVRTAPFTISAGPEGGGCVGSEAQLANRPSFEAGTQTPMASLYSPFVLKLSRGESSQRFRALNVTLPPGLTGRLAGITECTGAQIAQAESRRNPGEGALEQASPSCPSSSEVGTVTVGAGSGSPLYVQGRAYLAGPYKGAPLSLAIITPAIAGPFDLGAVVVRSALYVNESTAQISVKSDPIPTMLQGILLDVRSISVQIDKSDFTLNPTNCEAMAVDGEEISTTGSVATLRNRFQVGGCKGLKFQPKLQIQLKGPTKRAGHPALKAVVTYPKGEEYANIASAQVGLPHALFLDQGNLNKVCKQAELKAATCPKSSIYGHAKAWSPLLEKPLEGPVYLGVGYGYKLPALVADLNGKIRILLVGKVDTTKQNGLRNTFSVVPDAPVSRFVLEMKGGKKYGLLENSENLCAKTLRASARFVAQNGLVDHLTPQIAASCSKKKKSK
jgi:hypothetical protein